MIRQSDLFPGQEKKKKVKCLTDERGEWHPTSAKDVIHLRMKFMNDIKRSNITKKKGDMMKMKVYYTLAASALLSSMPITAVPRMDVRFGCPEVVQPGQKSTEFIVAITNTSTEGELLDEINVSVPLSRFYKLEADSLGQHPDDFGFELSLKNGILSAVAPKGIALLNPGEEVFFGAQFTISNAATGIITHTATAAATADGQLVTATVEPFEVTVKGEQRAVVAEEEVVNEPVVEEKAVEDKPVVEPEESDESGDHLQGCRIDGVCGVVEDNEDDEQEVPKQVTEKHVAKTEVKPVATEPARPIVLPAKPAVVVPAVLAPAIPADKAVVTLAPVATKPAVTQEVKPAAQKPAGPGASKIIPTAVPVVAPSTKPTAVPAKPAAVAQKAPVSTAKSSIKPGKALIPAGPAKPAAAKAAAAKPAPAKAAQPIYKEFTVYGSATMPTTPGGQDGSINMTVQDGLAPFTYALIGKQPSANPVIKGVAAGKYTVVVTDKTGRSKSLRVTVPRRA